ncbi:MAG: ribbon-helix-helix protein, CopG family [Propionibacteriaceae bacterium]|nr:ribbon-helix-helix protein, CopG family [Propionibacteriaceae bacterium]
MDMEELIAVEAEAAEQDRDAPLRTGARVTRGNGRAKTLQIRLNPEELAALTALAEERGLPVSTLARDMLLRELAAGSDDPRAVLARMRSDLESLASVVG